MFAVHKLYFSFIISLLAYSNVAGFITDLLFICWYPIKIHNFDKHFYILFALLIEYYDLSLKFKVQSSWGVSDNKVK